MTTVLEFGSLVLERRAAAGVRGIRSERHRFALHIAPTELAQKHPRETRTRDVRHWVREMCAKKAGDTRGDRLLAPSSIKRSFALISSVCTAPQCRFVAS